MALLRMLLEYSEEHAKGRLLEAPELVGYSPIEVHYHLALLDEAGWLETKAAGMIEEAEGCIVAEHTVKRLTWAGHEALDRLRTKNCLP